MDHHEHAESLSVLNARSVASWVCLATKSSASSPTSLVTNDPPSLLPPPPHIPTSMNPVPLNEHNPSPKQDFRFSMPEFPTTRQSSTAVADALHCFLTTEIPTTREFNCQHVPRRRWTCIGMIKLSLMPTIRPYTLPVQALTDRDFEVEKVIRAIHTQIQRRTSITGSHEQGSQSMDEERSATLQQENRLGSALALFKL
ncbi:hypothetical protein M378DRAFT_27692 [Amanita muscaria Koide BX008]|uniref:Uncharacterized protein n=1 Tax=Amanita muscaria (strain Koide BX008) TaxID=946122 RepID=A0A0C2SVN5_AMAMK|nr:hypothetical protein M378DRAFT_27692 [Amanita muscaria Koide BX008]